MRLPLAGDEYRFYFLRLSYLSNVVFSIDGLFSEYSCASQL